MKNSYKKLKLISRLAAALFYTLLGAILITAAYEAYKPSPVYSGAPSALSLLVGILSLIFLLTALIVRLYTKRKIKTDFPPSLDTKTRVRKKTPLRRLIKAGIIALASFLALLVLAPFIAIPLYLNQHVSYQGYATPSTLLQDIYEASDFGLEDKQRYLSTEDGLTVWTSEVYVSHPKAVVIYLSGIEQPSVTYFYGHSKYMAGHGIASFLLEVRGHGKSGGSRICLGYEEVKDVKALVEYIRSRSDYDGVPIVLHGVSMGGAAAVNAFGQLKEIDGLIAMSAYSSFEDVFTDTLKTMGMPSLLGTLERPLVTASLSLLFGAKTVRELKPVKQIQNAQNRPVFLISCTGDTEVSMENMLRLKEACPSAQTWLRDSWEHFIVKDCDFKNVAQDKEYCEKILNFLENQVIKQD